MTTRIITGAGTEATIQHSGYTIGGLLDAEVAHPIANHRWDYALAGVSSPAVLPPGDPEALFAGAAAVAFTVDSAASAIKIDSHPGIPRLIPGVSGDAGGRLFGKLRLKGWATDVRVRPVVTRWDAADDFPNVLPILTVIDQLVGTWERLEVADGEEFIHRLEERFGWATYDPPDGSSVRWSVGLELEPDVPTTGLETLEILGCQLNSDVNRASPAATWIPWRDSYYFHIDADSISARELALQRVIGSDGTVGLISPTFAANWGGLAGNSWTGLQDYVFQQKSYATTMPNVIEDTVKYTLHVVRIDAATMEMRMYLDDVLHETDTNTVDPADDNPRGSVGRSAFYFYPNNAIRSMEWGIGDPYGAHFPIAELSVEAMLRGVISP